MTTRDLTEEKRIQNVLYLLLQMKIRLDPNPFKSGARFSRGISTKTSGICHLFDYMIQESFVYNYSYFERAYTKRVMGKYLRKACKELGVYSGSKLYPISENNYGREILAPEVKAKYAFHDKNLWSIFTTYGRRRRKVLDKMIELIRIEIDNPQPLTSQF